MRRLVLNADDFGFTRGVNRAILEAHRRNIVTSATLMARGAEFDDAVRSAQSSPELGVGCHIVLVGGSPVLPAAEIPSLVAGHAVEASFRPGWGSFAAAALTRRLAAREIEAEATAQIRKLQQAGIAVTHVDTHQHVHIFPAVLQPILRAAQACGVRAVRNPFEPLTFGLPSRNFRLWKRWLGVGMLNAFRETFQRTVAEAGIFTPDGIFGVLATGRLDASMFRNIIERMPEGTWELLCHPGYDDAQLRSMPTRLWESRERELQTLTSPASSALLADHAIRLVSYRELTHP